MTVLSADQLTFSYDDQKPAVFKKLDFKIENGTFGLLTGPSGCGKSTLFKLLAGLYPQYGGQLLTGKVTLDGQNIAEIVPFARAGKVAMLFQNPSRQFAMRTVQEQLQFALENLQLSPIEIRQRISAALTELKLEKFRSRQLTTLSGGEQQRIALATILAIDSEIILLDEPFANVDPHGRQQLLADLKKLQQTRHKTILIADHDPSGYAGIADRLYHLSVHAEQIERLPLKNLQLAATTNVAVNYQSLNKGSLAWQQLQLAIGPRKLLTGSNFTLPEGQLGLLSGANGTGKSTLFAALCQQHDYQGSITFQQKSAQKFKLKRWADLVGIVFQNSSDQFISLKAASEINLSAKASHHPEYWTQARIDQAITSLNLKNVLDQVCYQLSGGQQKKLQLLSMLVMAPPVLLLDEPFAGLDAESLAAALALIKQATKALQLSILIISHQRLGVVETMDYELQLSQQQLTLLQKDGEQKDA
ncbi:ABC transporter ATP-binding protein [Liquorilactobacillus ghanensis]|uniref:ABC transporter ATP-binding protein n=1 Tax=Liquorilactobacillus ghanensis TaxID=399370 RepID=UPI0039E94704